MDKIQRYIQTLPSIYNTQVGSFIRALIEAWAQEDETIVTQIEQAKNQLFVSLASGKYLDILGSNVGVNRPSEINLSDDDYRKLIPAASFYPKQIATTMYDILDIFWGPLFSRANQTSSNVAPYNLGALIALTGTLNFTENNIAVTGVGTFFLAELSIGSWIKYQLDDNTYFKRVAVIESNTKLYLSDKYSHTVSGNGKKYIPKTLLIDVDKRGNEILYLNPIYFNNTASAMAEEIVMAINSSTNSGYVTASIIENILSNVSYVNLRTNVAGSFGSIQISGGTALSILGFSTDEILITSLAQNVILYETNPRELVVRIPHTVPILRRTLKGSHHFRTNYSGKIMAVDNVLKTITVNFDDIVTLNQHANHTFSQNRQNFVIQSHPAGKIGVVLQFSATDDFSFLVPSSFFSLTDISTLDGVTHSTGHNGIGHSAAFNAPITNEEALRASSMIITSPSTQITNGIAIEGWFNTGNASGGAFQPIFEEVYKTGHKIAISIVTVGLSYLGFHIEQFNQWPGDTPIFVDPAINLTDNTWYYCVFNWDVINGIRGWIGTETTAPVPMALTDAFAVRLSTDYTQLPLAGAGNIPAVLGRIGFSGTPYFGDAKIQKLRYSDALFNTSLVQGINYWGWPSAIPYVINSADKAIFEFISTIVGPPCNFSFYLNEILTFSLMEGFCILDKTPSNFIGSFIFDPNNANYTVSELKTTLVTPISAGNVYPAITVSDASDIPNDTGYLIFDFGSGAKEEQPIPYRGRPNNSTLLLNPAYVFTKNHSADITINYLRSLTATVPNILGKDYGIYVTGIETARLPVIELLNKIKAAGIVIRLIVDYPKLLFTQCTGLS